MIRHCLLALLLPICPLVKAHGHDHGHVGPMVFIQNNGQWNNAVRYKADVRGATVFLENGGLTYTKLEDRANEVMHDAINMSEEERAAIRFNGHAWHMRFMHPSPSMHITTGTAAPYYHNYFLGNVPSKWAGRVPLFDEITYNSVWPGVDMVLRSHEGHLKYDLVVAPGSDMAAIAFAYDGLDGMRIGPDGALVLKTSVGDLMELRPVVFYGDARNETITCRYELDGNVLRFVFPEGYDATRQVVIDPVLIAATYSGATGAANFGHCAGFDDFGNIYTGARNFGPTYPVSVGAFQTTFGGGGTDISLSKFNPDGSAQIWAAYLGGSGGENPHSLIANSNGELIVLGTTTSSNFPTTPGAFGTTMNQQAITVTRISSNGTALLGSTLVNGSQNDGINEISGNFGETFRGEVFLDLQENILVSSFTSSSDFPVPPGAYQTNLAGGQDGVVFKLDPTCSNMLASTYLGGSANDAAMGLRIANNGEIIVNGYTESSNFPTTGGAYQPSYQGGTTDGWVTRFDADLTTMVASTFFGTPEVDRSYFVDLDGDDNIWIYGQTTGQIAIQPAGTYGSAGGGIFVAKLASDLSEALITTVFGPSGSTGTVPVAFLVDNCNHIYVCGFDSDNQLPLTSDALYTNGSFYIAVFNFDMEDLLFGTFYGGSHVDGGTSRFDKNGVVYQGVCSGGQSMQSAPWAYAPVNQVGWDIGVFKLDFEQSGQVSIEALAPEPPFCVGSPITFNAVGNAITWLWDMDDGGPMVEAEQVEITYDWPGEYEILLIGIDSASCNIMDTATITLTVADCTVGMEGSRSSNRITIFPNPGNEHLMVSTNGMLGHDVKFLLYNVHGARVIERSISSNADIDVRSLDAGPYFYQVLEKGKVLASGKWIKDH